MLYQCTLARPYFVRFHLDQELNCNRILTWKQAHRTANKLQHSHDHSNKVQTNTRVLVLGLLILVYTASLSHWISTLGLTGRIESVMSWERGVWFMMSNQVKSLTWSVWLDTLHPYQVMMAHSFKITGRRKEWLRQSKKDEKLLWLLAQRAFSPLSPLFL